MFIGREIQRDAMIITPKKSLNTKKNAEASWLRRFVFCYLELALSWSQFSIRRWVLTCRPSALR
jgi:hypothetical protein